MRCLSLLVGILLFLSGCAVREHVPLLTGTEIPSSEVEKTLSELRSGKESVKDIKTLIRVKLSSGKETQSFRYAAVFKRPDALRIEVFPLNSFYTLSLLGIFKGSLVSLDTNERHAYTGTPTRSVLEKSFGLPLELKELSSLILAEVPSEDLTFKGVLDESIHKHRYLSSDSRIYFETGESDPRIERMKFFDEDGALVIDVTFAEYQELNHLSFPKRVNLLLSRFGIKGEMNFSNFSTNTAPSDALFLISIPEEYETTVVE